MTLGENGKMTIRSTQSNTQFEVLLRPGTLLIMAGGFNRNYLHSVQRSKSSNTRLNLTFRYIHHADPSQLEKSNTNTEIKSLDDKINALANAIGEAKTKMKTYAEAVTNTKVVILKIDNLDENPTTVSCMTKLNDHLIAENALSSNCITKVEDFRKKKGPLILELDTIKNKTKLLKMFKNNKDLIVKDCLDRNANNLRKQAIKLKEKKIIKAFWSYRGEIFYLPLNGSEGVKADWGKLNCLMKSNMLSADGR